MKGRLLFIELSSKARLSCITERCAEFSNLIARRLISKFEFDPHRHVTSLPYKIVQYRAYLLPAQSYPCLLFLPPVYTEKNMQTVLLQRHS